MFETKNQNKLDSNKRIFWIYLGIFLFFGVFIIKLFYMQVLNYSKYKTAALNDQVKQYEIPANRGEIDIQASSGYIPLVLNQKLYTLYSDPTFIKHPKDVADKIAQQTNISSDQIYQSITKKNTRYSVIAKKLTMDQSKKILALKIPGINTEAQTYRIYPQESLAAQTLGFVNDSGKGNYGIEQALNNELSGTPGKVKAVTDANGVPLAASNNNVAINPVNGSKVVLSLDLGIQSQLEKILANQYKNTNSNGLSAVVIDPNSGQIKAISNYPTFNPSNYQNVSDSKLFENAAITNAIEPGSIMKVLTTASSLNLGVVKPDTTFYDPGHWLIDGSDIKDVEQDGGAGQRDIASILALSLNTGAVWLLMQMGGGQINNQGISKWHDYLTNHFYLGKTTNLEQGYESSGYIPKLNFDNPSIDLTFANSSFGQGVQVTAVQMAAAVSSVVNGGTYYKPTLVDQIIKSDGTINKNNPQVLNKNVIDPKTSEEMLPLLENVVHSEASATYPYMYFSSDYNVGGKTGTAEVAQPGGGYYSNKFNGTFVGFVGGDKPQYVICVFNIQPTVNGFAGIRAGAPVFADIAHMLINDGYVSPKSK